MVAIMMLGAVLTVQDPSGAHVRTTEPTISALIHAGLEQSATFRRLVQRLNESDVILYVLPKLLRPGLGGYLANSVAVSGRYRYLRVALDMRGSTMRVVPVLAHELQHALEIANAPDARDARSVEDVFRRLRVSTGCGGSTSCFETRAALDVEIMVGAEVKAAR